jgi:iron complex outermembrane receptor protein
VLWLDFGYILIIINLPRVSIVKIRRSTSELALSATILAAALSSLPTVHAQGLVIEEVVVTAQRREQSLQDVPIAVSAFTEDRLKESGINYVTDLMAYTPGLTGARQGVGVTQFAIRGVSSNSFGVGGDNSVGIFVDDVYAGRSTIAGLPFIDIARVEVLKGPQGTLFGRNTSAGAISITSNEPNNEHSLSINQTVGQFNSYKTIATINSPIVEDVLMVRSSLVYEDTDGAIKNSNGLSSFGSGTRAVKVAMLYQPSDRFKALLNLSGQKVTEDGRAFEPDDSNSPFLQLAGVNNSDLFDRKAHHGSISDETTDVVAGNLKLSYELNKNITLTSISAFIEYVNDAKFDADGTPVRLLEAIFPEEESTSISQEFRLNGSTDKLDWMVGVSYHQEDISGSQIYRYDESVWLGVLQSIGALDPNIPAGGLGLPHPAFSLCDGSGVDAAILGSSCSDREESDISRGEFNSQAVYADLRYRANDKLGINVGLRYSKDEKQWSYQSDLSPGLFSTLGIPSVILTDITGSDGFSASQGWSKLTPRLAIDYQLNDDIMLYSSAAQGYKAGGYSAVSRFEEENTWSYEVGIKSSIWDGRGQLNISSYYYDYDDLQVQTIKNSVLRIENISTMVGKGLEVDFQFRATEDLDIFTTLAITKTEIGDHQTDNGNLRGNVPAYSPQQTASLVARYRIKQWNGMALTLQSEASYQSEQFFSVDNVKAESQSGYTIFNARLALDAENGDWGLALFGKNLADKGYLVNAYGLTEVVVQRGLPRYFGIEASYNF